jgi:hypothetical protein
MPGLVMEALSFFMPLERKCSKTCNLRHKKDIAESTTRRESPKRNLIKDDYCQPFILK